MKLLCDVESILEVVVRHLLTNEKCIEYWKKARSSKTHCLKNLCRDDKYADVLRTLKKAVYTSLGKIGLHIEKFIGKMRTSPVKDTFIQNILNCLSTALRVSLKLIYPGSAFKSTCKSSFLGDEVIVLQSTSRGVVIANSVEVNTPEIGLLNVKDLEFESDTNTSCKSLDLSEDDLSDDSGAAVEPVKITTTKVVCDKELDELSSLIEKQIVDNPPSVPNVKDLSKIVNSWVGLVKKLSDYSMSLEVVLTKIQKNEIVCCSCPLHCGLALNRDIASKRGKKPKRLLSQP